VRLDHVALATRDCSDALATLIGDLGGTLLAGGAYSAGFQSLQVLLGDDTAGMKVELLEPFDPEQNDFLDRFLTRHGEGPHHLTFKVDDLATTVQRVEAAGYTLVSVDLSDASWREAFLMPRDAHGTVVQLAESNDPRKSTAEEYRHALEHGVIAEPQFWPDPPPRAAARTFLRRVVMTTPDLSATVEFFTGLLDGDAWGRGPARGEAQEGDAPWVEIAWPGGGRVRVEEHGNASPGIDRLEVDGPGPPRQLVVANTRVVLSPTD